VLRQHHFLKCTQTFYLMYAAETRIWHARENIFYVALCAETIVVAAHVLMTAVGTFLPFVALQHHGRYRGYRRHVGDGAARPSLDPKPT
jgi:hypothetical protein